MPPPRLRLRLAALALLWVPSGLGGQSTEHGPLVLQLAPSSGAQALGGAFPLALPTSDAVFAHPAALVEASGLALSAQTYGPGGTYASASGATEWWGGGVAGGLRSLTYAAAVDAGTPTEADLFGEGPLAVSERAASIGYARELGGLRAGIVGTWLERRAGADRDRGLSADLGVAGEVSGATLALTVRNVGPDLDDDGPDARALPTDVTAGGAFRRLPVGPFDLGAAVAVSRRADGEVIPGGGLEVAWWPVVGRTFVARIGYRRAPEEGVEPLSLGGAFWGDAFGVEYSWRGADGPAGIHRIGIRWR